jgi:hypothetical protein
LAAALVALPLLLITPQNDATLSLWAAAGEYGWVRAKMPGRWEYPTIAEFIMN